ncbi:MAG: hypothetical protein M1827_004957 [Pycnora praestabilis]|nr:MAG: hypothetical protein M1827_004957 [Pycnora praestabilis]
MAPNSTFITLLSPAELSYLHSSLSLNPPIRPDARTPTQFRPLIAESDILPGTNGSARICFADGTEAVVGVKAEVEKSSLRPRGEHNSNLGTGGAVDEDASDDENGAMKDQSTRRGENAWVEMAIEIPGFRDDDGMPVFLAAMLNEALLASGDLPQRLWINRRWHWKLYIDILLLSPPLSYPLPLLSLTTHLALLSTRLPRLKSELDEDPLFDDDWDASIYLYPRTQLPMNKNYERPPVTLLVMAVGSNIIFDPSKEELAVAEVALAVSIGESPSRSKTAQRNFRLLAIRTIDPPSRLTPPGVPNTLNTAAGGTAPASSQDAIVQSERGATQGVWTPPRGGVKRGLIAKMIALVLKEGGVGQEVLDGLKGVDVG